MAYDTGRGSSFHQLVQFGGDLPHGEGLGGELLRRTGRLVGSGSLRLCDGVDLRDGRVDLGNALGLGLEGVCDLAKTAVDLLDSDYNVGERGCQFGTDRSALLAAAQRVADQVGGFLGCLGGALCQVPDFIGDPTDTGSGLARTGRLASGGQRPAMSLKGD